MDCSYQYIQQLKRQISITRVNTLAVEGLNHEKIEEYETKYNCEIEMEAKKESISFEIRDREQPDYQYRVVVDLEKGCSLMHED